MAVGALHWGFAVSRHGLDDVLCENTAAPREAKEDVRPTASGSWGGGGEGWDWREGKRIEGKDKREIERDYTASAASPNTHTRTLRVNMPPFALTLRHRLCHADCDHPRNQRPSVEAGELRDNSADAQQGWIGGVGLKAACMKSSIKDTQTKTQTQTQTQTQMQLKGRSDTYGAPCKVELCIVETAP